MNQLILILCLSPAIAMVTPNLDSISKALSKGDSTTLSQYFDDSVEISIMDEEDIYDKSEAKAIISGFFSKNAPSSFNQVHKGTSKGKDSHYCIGNLKAGGTTFRVYLYMKVLGGSYVIQEIRIDKE